MKVCESKLKSVEIDVEVQGSSFENIACVLPCAVNCCIEITKTLIYSLVLSNDALRKNEDSLSPRFFVCFLLVVSSRSLFR